MEEHETTRRRLLAGAAAAGLAVSAVARGALASAPAAGPGGGAALPPGGISPSILDYLTDLNTAVGQIGNSWKPDDPAYRADMYRQIMMNLSYAYFPYFHADPEHPDWSPLWNPVYTHQPNPDDIYLYCPLRSDLTYRVSGSRGTVRRLIFTTQHGLSGLSEPADMGEMNNFDDGDIHIGPDGRFEVLFSARRPAGHAGNWAPLSPRTDVMMLRFRAWDWNEQDPQLSIECLDPVPPKPRLTPAQIIERIRLMAQFPGRMDKLFLALQNDVKAKTGVNHFGFWQQPGMKKQYYWPAVFQLNPDEALIIETDLPKVRPYWNIQLNDPYFNAVEYVYRMSSLNGATARVSADGKLRAVIALEDPGVPNWLDPAGYTEGTIYGRWYDCDSQPLPVIRRVRLAELRAHLPPDTPIVSREARAAELAARVRAAQRRRRW